MIITQTLFFFLLLITTFLFVLASSSSSSQHLPKGSTLYVEDAARNLLISPKKTFTCGFYTFNETTHAYYFSIWYTNSYDKNNVVWTANSEKPVNGRGSKITLRKDGALVLTDLDGSHVWQTNTSSTTVDRAELLDSGNLVLKNTSGHILWQSFDYPTDTLLPNQRFTKNKRLVSRMSKHVFAPGSYSLFFDSDNVLRLMYDGPEITSIYWPDIDRSVYENGRTNYNSSRVASFDNKGTFVSSDFLQFSASDLGIGVERRLTMDYDGNLRLYSLNKMSGLWDVTWQALAKQCDVHGLCGRNGICIYTPEPKCSCPPHFEPSSSDDWSKGCKAKFHRSHNDTQFLEVPQVDYYGFDLNATNRNISFKKCRNLCLGDFRCLAFKYIMRGSMKCLTKGALFNGYRAKTSLHMRMPMKVETQLEPKIILNVSQLKCGGNKGPRLFISLPNTYYDLPKHNFKWVYVYSFGGVIGAIEVIIFVASWFFLFRKHGISASMEEGYKTISSQFQSFSYNELKRATNNFKQVLGEGGFGAVYKGVLADARVVAIKKLESIVQGEEEFLGEVSTFGRINHMNLARMWGFCSQGKHRLLVYEYVENGSLDNHLFSSSPSNSLLGWEKRFNIALGTARGLAYLHHECLEWVIHCDVKPENILLDINFEPKISDFGLAKLCQRGDNHCGLLGLSKIRGTKGYMAPEWTTNLPLTAKVDVYSYGVVILELVKGSRLSRCTLADHCEEDAMQGDGDGDHSSWIEGFVDSKLEGEFSKLQAAKLIEVGLQCVEDDRNKRPTMESITQLLIECEDQTLSMHI